MVSKMEICSTRNGPENFGEKESISIFGFSLSPVPSALIVEAEGKEGDSEHAKEVDPGPVHVQPGPSVSASQRDEKVRTASYFTQIYWLDWVSSIQSLSTCN